MCDICNKPAEITVKYAVGQDKRLMHKLKQIIDLDRVISKTMHVTCNLCHSCLSNLWKKPNFFYKLRRFVLETIVKNESEKEKFK